MHASRFHKEHTLLVQGNVADVLYASLLSLQPETKVRGLATHVI